MQIANLEVYLTEHMAEAPKVKSIPEEELGEFLEYRKSTEMIPLVTDIQQ